MTTRYPLSHSLISTYRFRFLGERNRILLFPYLKKVMSPRLESKACDEFCLSAITSFFSTSIGSKDTNIKRIFQRNLMVFAFLYRKDSFTFATCRSSIEHSGHTFFILKREANSFDESSFLFAFYHFSLHLLASFKRKA